MSHSDIDNILVDRTVKYLKVVVDYRSQKEDSNRVWITVGGNLIEYPGEIMTRTVDLVTSKLLWNSLLGTPDAKYMTVDIKGFYLNTPLDRYEYMKMLIGIMPGHNIKQYGLKNKVRDGFMYMECQKRMYGLPQAGILANKILKKWLAKFRYIETRHTLGLWKHVWWPVQFKLVVENFGVKYVGRVHAEHLCKALQKGGYQIETD